MVDFMNILSQWENLGVFNILLPFLLVFAIVFAVLEKISLFGTGKRQINGIIAVILGILFIRNQYLVGIVNRFLPNISLFMIIILMFLLLIGIFAGQYNPWQGSLLGLATIVSLFFVIWSLSSDYLGQRWDLPDWLFGFDETTKATIIFVAIFVGVIWFVAREPQDPNKPRVSGWLERLGEGVGGGPAQPK